MREFLKDAPEVKPKKITSKSVDHFDVSEISSCDLSQLVTAGKCYTCDSEIIGRDYVKCGGLYCVNKMRNKCSSTSNVNCHKLDEDGFDL